ncbi:TetR family transcriptional regulator [Skermanella stibiiresistens SB22]|uniref:TetR family transcriptional regulator n=1 Tax=Skermanella stibiiresistens SB22 TaxID=1385369 RepID=W9H0Z1_9PROT|nr:TetR/AcrR family transcriptional regulator [Skermanella stibiiresistens]EWY39719.1 TetR family transcriptional regulator [Skermanella stibiiresistens SB22]
MRDPATKSARDRVLDAAAELFYRDGIRAVGVDAVIAHSGVAKMSLYRNFAGKDELVAAYLEYRDRLYWEWWDGVMARHPGDPRAQIRALFAAVAKRTTSASYRGCPFINTAVEFPDPDHPGHVAAKANKRELRNRLRGLALAVGAADLDLLADQLHLLLDGAYTSGQTLGAEGVGHAAPAAAEALVEAAVAVLSTRAT